ncbi:MAG: hypothetical protein F9K35_10495, partial [Burkholderiaceae bacterium]
MKEHRLLALSIFLALLAALAQGLPFTGLSAAAATTLGAGLAVLAALLLWPAHRGYRNAAAESARHEAAGAERLAWLE